MTHPSNPGTVAPLARDELRDLLFAGTFESHHQSIREVLLDPIFDPQPGLNMEQAGRLAYARSRHVHAALERPLQILANPRRLFALAEWPSLLDVASFSLLMVHYNLCLGTVFDHAQGRPDIAGLTEALDELTSFGPYMATELGFGNNVAALQTEAVYDRHSQTFTLNTPSAGAQKYMSYSGFGDIPKVATVMARLKIEGKDHGVFPFLIRLSTEAGLCPGIRAALCPEKPVQGLDNGLTWFDNVRVPRSSLLHGDMGHFAEDGSFVLGAGNARSRFLRAMSRIVPGRLCVASAAQGASRASLYIALRYGQQRLTNAPGTNDMPVIEYRSYQRAMFSALACTYAMTLLLNEAKARFLANTAEPAADVVSLINITKALATWDASAVIAECRERCGAQGIFSVNRIADYGSLLQGLVTAEGDNLVLLATVAGQLLAQAWQGPLPLRPARARRLAEPEWLIAAIAFREYQLWLTVREEMNADERGYFEVWNDAMNPGLELARLRGERLALEQLWSAALHAQQDEAKAALNGLASLYGLNLLQRDAAWFLAHELIDAGQALSLPGRIDQQCVALRPCVSTLIDGFALSPELLRAPIAEGDYIQAFCKQVHANVD
ncbi:acyl-CoA dehydrogenase [Pseudomonas sp. OV546]|uniref:acyl-CoA dehydrogenase family protein n=1 Tax=Pseudomonas sp. OV546 TaxID=1881063 RepID=UPI0008EF7ADC|nr:acyl-CoA dehydrogenase [Pseudomonas sp. OV546]SFV09432.1 Acyl-coenzyme A oxidase [Pseudomonas sp. OV546]